jgi:hypothetical protein
MTYHVVATASIGIQIKLFDLLSQINESNWERIRTLMTANPIIDSNKDDNNDYWAILNNTLWDDDKERGPCIFKDKPALEMRELLMGKFHDNELLDKYWLYPIRDIVTTEIRSLRDEGDSGTFAPIPTASAADLEPYKDLKNITVVLILAQNLN